MTQVIKDKDNLRKIILAERSALSLAALRKAEIIVWEKLTSMSQYKASRTVMAYMDFRKEVPTHTILDQIISDGKRLILPLTDPNFSIIPYEIDTKGKTIQQSLDLFTRSSFGIMEPNPESCPVVDPAQIDLILIPGSVFDNSGNRIGYGKGCYDRFLPLLRPDTYKLALAYSFQVLDHIPTDPNDVKMDQILVV